MKALPLRARFLSLANSIWSLCQNFTPAAGQKPFPNFCPNFSNKYLITVATFVSLAFTLFNAFINSSHKFFFLFSLHVCASLVRHTFSFPAWSQHFFCIPFSYFIKMNYPYDEEGRFPVPYTLALIFTYFCQSKKKFETYQVAIHQDQVCLCYCNIAGIQWPVPVLHRTEQVQFKHGHN